MFLLLEFLSELDYLFTWWTPILYVYRVHTDCRSRRYDIGVHIMITNRDKGLISIEEIVYAELNGYVTDDVT